MPDLAPLAASASRSACARTCTWRCEQGRFDVVHGFEPGLPSISYLALRDSEALGVATFFSPERLGYPPRRALREKLLGRIDALIATSRRRPRPRRERFPGDYRDRLARRRHRALPARREAQADRDRAATRARCPVARAALRSLRELPGWEAVLLRTKPLSTRPAIPAGAARPRARPLRPRRRGARAACSPRRRSSSRPRRARRGCGSRRRPRAPRSPIRRACSSSPSSPPRRSPASPRTTTLRERTGAGGARRRRGAELRAPSRPSSTRSTASLARPPPRRAGATPTRSPTAPWILADLHMHTSWSHDCSIEVDELLDHAEAEGLGAIAVTDHNVFGGALEAVERARGRDLIVIPGEEVKTDDQGEVIGLFLREEIPRGMSFAETVAAIREQEGVVYLPHPFDRMHAIPFPATLHRHLHEHRRARGLQRPPALRGLQRRGAALRAQVRAAGGRRLGRARPPGRRHGRAADAGVRRARRSSCSRCAPPRCCAGRSRSPTSRASSGWRRSRRRCARREPRDDSVCSAVPTDEIYERYLQKAISEINELGDEIGRAGDETHVPCSAPGTRWRTSSCSSTRRSRPRCTRASRSTAAPGRRC